MMEFLEPLRSTNLTHIFVERFEDLILSGSLPIGEMLPPERALAERLGVSRPVVHEGLVELAARGLVTMKPRVGTVVNDYRREGSLALLASLINHPHRRFSPPLLEGMLSLRRLVQADAARLAARQCGNDGLAELDDVLAREAAVGRSQLDAIVAVDLAFHHTIALASGNPIYPLLLKSFEAAEKSLASRFFATSSVVPIVFDFHRRITTAIREQDERRAEALMMALLDHGREILTHGLAPSSENQVEDRPPGRTRQRTNR